VFAGELAPLAPVLDEPAMPGPLTALAPASFGALAFVAGVAGVLVALGVVTEAPPGIELGLDATLPQATNSNTDAASARCERVHVITRNTIAFRRL